MLSKIQSALKSPMFWVALVLGVIVAVAYSAKIPAFVKKVAGYLPGSTSSAA